MRVRALYKQLGAPEIQLDLCPPPLTPGCLPQAKEKDRFVSFLSSQVAEKAATSTHTHTACKLRQTV